MFFDNNVETNFPGSMNIRPMGYETNQVMRTSAEHQRVGVGDRRLCQTPNAPPNQPFYGCQSNERSLLGLERRVCHLDNINHHPANGGQATPHQPHHNLHEHHLYDIIKRLYPNLMPR